MHALLGSPRLVSFPPEGFWRGFSLHLGAALLLFSFSSAAAEEGHWENGVGYRRRSLNVAPGAPAGFTLVGRETTGISWTNRLSEERLKKFQNLMSGCGVAAGDFDGDGLCDLYFCNREGPNALYRNLGNFRFQDVTQSAGVACEGQSSSGAVFADINGDGRLDLLVTSFSGPNACFLNIGNGRFTNITASSGLKTNGGCTSMALADVDGDGDLDLYVCYFGMESVLRDGGDYSIRVVNGQPV